MRARRRALITLGALAIMCSCDGASPTAGLGGWCTSNPDCTSGLCIVDGNYCTTHCATDCDCGTGYHCVASSSLSVCARGTNECTGAPPAPDAGVACSGAGQTCALVSDCCPGHTCTNFGSSASCAANCTSGTDCVSGCCAPLEGGGAVCAASSYCAPACTRNGGTCAAPADCCEGSTCVRFTEGTVCSATCTSNAGCTSGCCVELTSGGGACGAASYCGTCTPAGSECSPGDCCPGSTCVWIEYVGARCQVQGECPASCRNPFGSSCCRPPYCAGDCVGSPCC